MSETNKTKQVPNNTINYIVFGKENELELNVTGNNTQDAVQTIPGIPMEISVESHNFDIMPNGEIVRVNKNGERLPGKVTNSKVAKRVRENEEIR